MGNRDGTPEQYFAQDPAFTQTDVQFLERCRLTITPRPRSEKLVDEKTFVMLPFTPMDSSIQGGKSHPALMIGLPYEHILNMAMFEDTVQPGEERAKWTTKRSKRSQRVQDVRGEFERFVVCEPNWVFSCMFCEKHRNGTLHQLNRLEVYVRKDEHEEK